LRPLDERLLIGACESNSSAAPLWSAGRGLIELVLGQPFESIIIPAFWPPATHRDRRWGDLLARKTVGGGLAGMGAQLQTRETDTRPEGSPVSQVQVAPRVAGGPKLLEDLGQAQANHWPLTGRSLLECSPLAAD